jgi:hypothetical protein
MTDDTPQVEQRHREAAASYYAATAFGADKASILAQMLDREAADEEWIDPLSYLFARFEATHLATLTAERDAIVNATLDAAERAIADTLAFGAKDAALQAIRALRTDAPGTQEGE